MMRGMVKSRPAPIAGLGGEDVVGWAAQLVLHQTSHHPDDSAAAWSELRASKS